MSEYDPIDDVWKSVEVAYEAIRERMKNGGPGWVPSATLTLDGMFHQRREDEATAGGPVKVESRSESFEGRQPTR